MGNLLRSKSLWKIVPVMKTCILHKYQKRGRRSTPNGVLTSHPSVLTVTAVRVKATHSFQGGSSKNILSQYQKTPRERLAHAATIVQAKTTYTHILKKRRHDPKSGPSDKVTKVC